MNLFDLVRSRYAVRDGALEIDPPGRDAILLGLVVSVAVSYALTLSSFQLFDLNHDDAAGAFAGSIDQYYPQYGADSSRHGILETLFRHLASDASIQIARFLVVILGVFPASFLTFIVCRRVIGLGMIGAAMASSIPFLVPAQLSIPYSFNASYPAFDMAVLMGAALLVKLSSRQARSEIGIVLAAAVLFLISEGLVVGPFIAPFLLAVAICLRWRSPVSFAAMSIAIVAGSLKLVLQSQTRLSMTPGTRVREGGVAGVFEYASQAASNFVDVSTSFLQLGALSAPFLAAAAAAVLVGSSVLSLRNRPLARFNTALAGLALLFIPIVGYAAAADGFQLRYAFDSHFGVAIVLGLLIDWGLLGLKAVRWLDPRVQRGVEGALLAGATLAIAYAAYWKSALPPPFVGLSQFNRGLAQYLQEPPSAAVRSDRVHQYLIMTDGIAPRNSLLPHATAFGYVRLYSGNPRAVGWVGPVTSCGNPYRTDWQYWGRTKLPGALTEDFPIRVLGYGGKFRNGRDFEYFLATKTDDPTASIGDAEWRLFGISDDVASEIARGAGEEALVETLLGRSIDPENVALNCGVQIDGFPGRNENLVDMSFSPADWENTNGQPSTLEFEEGEIQLPVDSRGVMRAGLPAAPGDRFRLRLEGRFSDAGSGEALPVFRVGPVAYDQSGQIVLWWTPQVARDIIGSSDGDVFAAERVVVAPQGARSVHIAFLGQISAETDEVTRGVTITAATLERVEPN